VTSRYQLWTFVFRPPITSTARGPNVTSGYWRNPEATRKAFASGWFETGDLGQRDDGGFLTLVGRSNDLSSTNGYNV